MAGFLLDVTTDALHCKLISFVDGGFIVYEV